MATLPEHIQSFKVSVCPDHDDESFETDAEKVLKKIFSDVMEESDMRHPDLLPKMRQLVPAVIALKTFLRAKKQATWTTAHEAMSSFEDMLSSYLKYEVLGDDATDRVVEDDDHKLF